MKEFPDKCEEGKDMAGQTFTLTITDMKRGEWQGRLVGEDKYAGEFRRVIELIKAISQKIDSIEKIEMVWRHDE